MTKIERLKFRMSCLTDEKIKDLHNGFCIKIHSVVCNRDMYFSVTQTLDTITVATDDKFIQFSDNDNYKDMCAKCIDWVARQVYKDSTSSSIYYPLSKVYREGSIIGWLVMFNGIKYQYISKDGEIYNQLAKEYNKTYPRNIAKVLSGKSYNDIDLGDTESIGVLQELTYVPIEKGTDVIDRVDDFIMTVLRN